MGPPCTAHWGLEQGLPTRRHEKDYARLWVTRRRKRCCEGEPGQRPGVIRKFLGSRRARISLGLGEMRPGVGSRSDGRRYTWQRRRRGIVSAGSSHHRLIFRPFSSLFLGSDPDADALSTLVVHWEACLSLFSLPSSRSLSAPPVLGARLTATRAPLITLFPTNL